MADDGMKELSKKLSDFSKEYQSLSEPEFTRSGSVVIDAILGGGIPKGTMIVWSSESGCGKSTGALHISRTYCMQGKRVLYLDYEHGVNSGQIDGMGLREYLYDETKNPDGNFILFQLQTYKDAEGILDKIMGSLDLVIIDSVTAMLTENVRDKSSEDVVIGVDARVTSAFLKKYKADVSRTGCTWLLINQMRTKIATGYGQQTHDAEAGGNALKFYPDIRLMMKKAYKGELVKEEETVKGPQKVPFGAINTIYAIKNRYERPNIPMNVAIIFGRGIDNNFAYYDFLENQRAIKKTGAWYNIKIPGVEPAKLQGINKVIEWIGSNKDDVRGFINSKGGYRLLMNEENPIEIESKEAEGAYDTDIGADFDEMIGDVEGVTSIEIGEEV